MVWNTSPTHVLHLCHIRSDSVKRSNKEEAMELTRQKLKMTSVTFNANDRFDFDIGPFDLEMDRDTPPRHGLYVCV